MTGQQTFERRRLDAIAAVAGLAVLIICAVIVRDGTVRVARAAGLRGHQRTSGGPRTADAARPVPRCACRSGRSSRSWRWCSAGGGWRSPRSWSRSESWPLSARVWNYVEPPAPGRRSEPNAIVRGGTATSGVSFVSGHVILVTALAWVVTPYLRGRWRLRAVGRRRDRVVRPGLPGSPQPARCRRGASDCGVAVGGLDQPDRRGAGPRLRHRSGALVRGSPEAAQLACVRSSGGLDLAARAAPLRDARR